MIDPQLTMLKRWVRNLSLIAEFRRKSRYYAERANCSLLPEEDRPCEIIVPRKAQKTSNFRQVAFGHSVTP